ncbi:MAG: alpha/beta hydrolase [Candidatus Methanofastidiosia archaeon]|jgi:pimeloyl-ACP methyl ester carboxylesterase
MNKIEISIVCVALLAGAAGLYVFPESVSKESICIKVNGEHIYYLLYYPDTVSESTPVVVIGHGINVNKEMMETVAVELASHNYVAATIDWGGHGRSTGELVRDELYTQVDAVMTDILEHVPVTLENSALIGYSMGGYPTYKYAVSHDVKAWVGMGTVVPDISGTGTDNINVLLVISPYDEAFSLEAAQNSLTNLIGIPGPQIEYEKVYGDTQKGTARKIHLLPWADHLTTPWSADAVSHSVSWISQTFEGEKDFTLHTYYQRLLFLGMGIVGMVGVVVVVSNGLSKKFERVESTVKIRDMSVRAFIVKYYVVTIASIPLMGVFIPLFLTPLPFSALLTTVTGGLGIGLFLFCWRLTKDTSLKSLLKNNVISGKYWVYSVIVTIVYVGSYYSIVGLHFLGMIPSYTRIVYLGVYTLILFVIFLFYSLCIQKVCVPFFKENITTSFWVTGFISFLLIYSWVTLVILVPCIIIGNYFLAMILLLMGPIFLFLAFYSVYTERVTGSILPNTVLQSVWLGLLVTTLSPYVSGITMM